MIHFSHGAATSVGRVRKVNEDSYLAVPPIFVVADGMGGHGCGDLASRIAIEDMSACVPLRPLFAEAVLTALEHANRHIIEHSGAERMGTTATGLAALETAGGDRLMVFNVGDSRVYRLAGNRLHQLTVDHSEVQELVLAGVITREQARTHPRRNVITRALGNDTGRVPDHWLLPAVTGDRYLICSDGLFSELPDEGILPLLAAGSPQQAAETLVAAANDAGGHDNVTVVVVDIESDGHGADEPTLPRQVLSPDVLPEVAQLLPALDVLPDVARRLAAAVDDDLGEPGVADEPDHRAVGVLGGVASVDGTLGEQRAALVGHVRPGRGDDDQLAAEGVDLQGDLAAGEDSFGEVDDQGAEADGQPGVPSGHPPAGADHLAEPGGDRRAARGRHVGLGRVAVRQVAGERRELAQGPRGVRGVEPLRVLGARQAADGHGAGQQARRAIPVGVAGAQVGPLLTGEPRSVGYGQAVVAWFRHAA